MRIVVILGECYAKSVECCIVVFVSFTNLGFHVAGNKYFIDFKL